MIDFPDTMRHRSAPTPTPEKDGGLIPIKIKHQIVANTVVVLENGDVIVGQAVATDVQLQVGVKDDQGRQAYAVNWTLKIGRPT